MFWHSVFCWNAVKNAISMTSNLNRHLLFTLMMKWTMFLLSSQVVTLEKPDQYFLIEHEKCYFQDKSFFSAFFFVSIFLKDFDIFWTICLYFLATAVRGLVPWQRKHKFCLCSDRFNVKNHLICSILPQRKMTNDRSQNKMTTAAYWRQTLIIRLQFG